MGRVRFVSLEESEPRVGCRLRAAGRGMRCMSPPSLHRHQHLVERVPCAREPIDSRAFIQSMRKEGPWHSIRPSASHVWPRAMAQAAGHTARRRRRGAPLPPPLAHQQHTRELRRWVSRRLAAGHVMSVGQVLGGAGRKRSLDDDELWRTSRHVSGGLGVRGGGVWRGSATRQTAHMRLVLSLSSRTAACEFRAGVLRFESCSVSDDH